LPSQPINQVTLDKHVSDVFKALVDLSNERTSDNFQLFLRFVWLRCHRKIKHRLRADEVMLGKPLADLLEEWVSSFSDTVEEEWLATSPPFHDIYDDHGIEFRILVEQGTREYLFSSNTIRPWCQIFVLFLRILKVDATSCDMLSPDSIDCLNQGFHMLSLLLYQNRALDKILALPSLSRHLAAAMRGANETDDEPSECFRRYLFILFLILQLFSPVGVSIRNRRRFRSRQLKLSSYTEFMQVDGCLVSGSSFLVSLKDFSDSRVTTVPPRTLSSFRCLNDDESPSLNITEAKSHFTHQQ
jgi:hypothetical protein